VLFTDIHISLCSENTDSFTIDPVWLYSFLAHDLQKIIDFADKKPCDVKFQDMINSFNSAHTRENDLEISNTLSGEGIYISTYMYMGVRSCVRACVRTCMYAYVRKYIYIYICMYIYTHEHTCTDGRTQIHT
jgi:hypothetical protein